MPAGLPGAGKGEAKNPQTYKKNPKQTNNPEPPKNCLTKI